MDGDLRVLLSEDDADAERIDALTGLLRTDLLQLDVDDVTALRAGEAPPGTRVFDPATVGALVVTLGHSAQSLAAVISAVRAWLGRGSGTRRTIRLELGGDVLELSQASVTDQDRLISLFVTKHTAEQG